MAKSAFTDAHSILVKAFIDARMKSGLTQAELGARVGKDQSFISNIERGQRRIDLLEFYVLARAMGRDPAQFYAEILTTFPSHVAI